MVFCEKKMKFLRLVSCVTVVVGTVIAWEHCRGYVLEQVNANKINDDDIVGAKGGETAEKILKQI